jgi:hypothetical protein
MCERSGHYLNNARARRHSITYGRLDEVHRLNRERGGASYRLDNIPLTSEGRIAFIDRAFAPEARRAIAGINHCVKFLSHFTRRLDIRGANIQK